MQNGLVMQNAECKMQNIDIVKNIMLYDLKRLIRSPLETKLNKLFNIFEEKDSKKIEQKPIYIDKLANWEFVIPFINEYITNSIDNKLENCELKKFIEDNFDKYFKYNTLLARVPTTKILMELTKEELYKELKIYEEEIELIKNEYSSFKFYNSFLFIDSNNETDYNQDRVFYIKPIEIKKEDSSKNFNIKISGRENLFLFEDDDKKDYRILVVSTSTSQGKDMTHHILEPFLFFLAALNSIDNFPEKIILNVIYRDGVVKMLFNVKREEARDFINSLVESLFDEDNFDNIDFDTANEVYNSKTKDFDFDSYLDYIDKKEDIELSIKNIVELPQLTKDEFRKIIDDRFRLIFNSVEFY
jgi:hypothetical protein